MTQVAYRVAKAQYAMTSDQMFSGRGAEMYGGRWNSVGRPMVYCSDSRALALLEMAVHLNNASAIGDYHLCEVAIRDDLVLQYDIDALTLGWDEPALNPLVAQAMGDEWLEEEESPVLKVPSVIVQSEWNYLINPRHSDVDKLALGVIASHPFDPRIKE